MKAAIIGGGIGGMATAIALRMHGIDVAIYEQASKFEEVGAGIQISPNGYHVLAALGVSEAIENVAFEPESIEMRHGGDGRVIVDIPIQRVARLRWGAPYLHMRRSALHDVLVKRANELDVTTYLNRKVQPVDLDGLSADIIIASDGLHSQFRNQFFDATPVRFSGKTAWRSVVPASRLDIVPPKNATVWAGKNLHAVTTWVNGGKSINFVGISEGDWRDTNWNGIANKNVVDKIFTDFDPRIREIIKKSQSIMKWALFEHEPLNWLSHGNIALIGDAAHPMMPSLAQGGVMALEDAWVLAKCLSDDPINGLENYSKARIKRVSRVQKESLQNLNRFHRDGLYQWSEQFGAKVLNRVMPSYFIKRLDWLYGLNVTLD